jgi:hypothetical protein
LLGLALAAVVGRYAVLPRILRSAIREAAGSQVEFGRLRFTGAGLIAENVVLRIPDTAGEAGELLTIEQADINLRIDSLLPLAVEVEAVHLRGADLRISQSEVTGVLAAASLRANVPTAAPGSTVSADGQALPTLTLSKCRVHYGLHDEAGAFTPLTNIEVEGSAQPSQDHAGVYDVSLRQMHQADPREVGLRVVGTVSPAESSGSLRLRNFSFDDLSAEVLPERVRAWWARAALSGDVSDASLEFTPDAVDAVITLAGVDLTLDVPLAYMSDTEAAPLQLREARGVIRFDQRGVALEDLRVTVQDLDCRLSGRYEGYAEDSAVGLVLEVEPFDIRQTEGLLPFVPYDVQTELHQFEFEQATLSGVINAQRRGPGSSEESPLRIRADFDVEQFFGRTAYFPYHISEGAGRISFTDGRLLIDLRGEGDTGAELDVSVSVEPKPINSEVDVRVTARQVPADEHLREALWEESARVLDALMNRPAYERLLAAGLLRPEGEASPDSAGPPAFTLGALSDVDVIVHRGEDTKGEFDHHVTIALHQGSFLYEHFTYPVRLRQGTIIVTDSDAWLELPELFGPTGERLGSLSGTVVLSRDGVEVYEPSIEVNVDAMPIDRYLAYALPDSNEDATGPDTAPLSRGGRLIEAWGMRGFTSGSARITPDGADGADFRVECIVRDAAATPGDGSYPLEQVDGRVIVTKDGIQIEQLTARHGETEFVVSGAFSSLGDDSEDAEVVCDLGVEVFALAVAEPFEQVLEPFLESDLLRESPTEELAALRARYQPTGSADATVRITAGQGQAPGYEADLRLRDPAFQIDDTRIRLGGLVEGITVAEGWARFSGTQARLLDGDATAAALDVTGNWHWANPGEAGDDAGAAESTLSLRVDQADLASESLRQALRLAGDGMLVDLLQRYAVTGLVGTDLVLHRQGDGNIDVRGEVQPLWLTIDDKRLESMTGTVSFGDDRVELRELAGALNGGRLTMAGDMQFERIGAEDQAKRLTRVDLGFEGELDRFVAAEWSTLLGTLGQRLADVEFAASERFRVQEGQLRYVSTDRPEEDRLRVEARVEMLGGSFNLGLPIEQLNGDVDVQMDKRAWQEYAAVQVWGRADTFRLRGVDMADLRFRLANGDEPGELLVPHIEATCHDGKIAGQARVLVGRETDYELQLQLENVRLGRTLRDLRRVAEEQATKAPPTEVAEELAERQPVQGRVAATVALRGTVGKPEALSGRTTARVAGKGVVELPVMLSLIQLSNFLPPANDRFDLAELDFHFKGREIIFERADLLGSTIWIDGRGRLDLDDLGIDMIFTTQGRLPDLGAIPDLFTDLMLGLRNELITMQAAGTLYNPEFRPRTLLQTRRTLAEIFGTERQRLEKPVRRETEKDRPLRQGP